MLAGSIFFSAPLRMSWMTAEQELRIIWGFAHSHVGQLTLTVQVLSGAVNQKTYSWLLCFLMKWWLGVRGKCSEREGEKTTFTTSCLSKLSQAPLRFKGMGNRLSVFIRRTKFYRNLREMQSPITVVLNVHQSYSKEALCCFYCYVLKK